MAAGNPTETLTQRYNPASGRVEMVRNTGPTEAGWQQIGNTGQWRQTGSGGASSGGSGTTGNAADAGNEARILAEASQTNAQRQLASDIQGMLRNSNNVAGQSSSTAGRDAAAAKPLNTPVQAPGAQMQAGMDAALLRAKEKQGQIARSALTGLREALGERQMLGSGAEAQATGDITAAALGSLSDVNREQLIQGDENARRLAELSYQGSIQQRGQDITARGQDIQAALGDANIGQAQATQYFDQQQALLNALKGLVY